MAWHGLSAVLALSKAADHSCHLHLQRSYVPRRMAFNTTLPSARLVWPCRIQTLKKRVNVSQHSAESILASAR